MKKKLGRPRLPKSEARSILLTTRVNAGENRAIGQAIKDSGQDKTEWLRNALLYVASNGIKTGVDIGGARGD